VGLLSNQPQDEERLDLVILTWTVLRDNDHDVDPLYLVPLAAEALDALLSRMPPSTLVRLPQLADVLALSAPAASRVGLGQVRLLLPLQNLAPTTTPNSPSAWPHTASTHEKPLVLHVQSPSHRIHL
jgi:hypothetical protein